MFRCILFIVIANVFVWGQLSKSPRQLLTLRNPRGHCTPISRKEYREMSRADWMSFHDAIEALTRMPSPDGREGLNEMDWWTQVHLNSVRQAHLYTINKPFNRALFFPFYWA